MIIHPCETLKEMLENKSMSQNELAQRAGVTPKHISTILSGEKILLRHLQKNSNMCLALPHHFG